MGKILDYGSSLCCFGLDSAPRLCVWLWSESTQDFILGNLQSSLWDLIVLPSPTQDCVLGYFQYF